MYLKTVAEVKRCRCATEVDKENDFEVKNFGYCKT